MCARIRVSCRVVSVCRLHGVRTYRMGGHCQQPPRPGGALNSVPDVFVHSLFQSGKPCKRLGLHSFAPAVCCAALSVLVCRLCPAVVTHCLCRGTLGELEVMLMVPCHFCGSHKHCARESKPGDPYCRVVRTTASCSAEYLRAAVDFS